MFSVTIAYPISWLDSLDIFAFTNNTFEFASFVKSILIYEFATLFCIPRLLFVSVPVSVLKSNPYLFGVVEFSIDLL